MMKKRPQRLLHSRVQTARLLGCSVPTVIRLERAGELKPIRLTKKEQSKVFYRDEDVAALVERAGE